MAAKLADNKTYVLHSILALSLTRFAFRNPNGITCGYAAFDLLLQNSSITKRCFVILYLQCHWLVHPFAARTAWVKFLLCLRGGASLLAEGWECLVRPTANELDDNKTYVLHSIFAMSLARSSFCGPHGMSLTHAACDQPLMNSPITKLKFCHSIFAMSLTRFAFRNPNGITCGYAAFDLLLQNSSITKLMFCHSEQSEESL